MSKTASNPIKHSVSRIKTKFLEIFKEPEYARPALHMSDLIDAESALGATIFGAIPEGHTRKFFNYKKNLWIFHESWMEGDTEKGITIQYEIRADGVYKRPTGGQYVKIKGEELKNFHTATKEYLKIIKKRLY